MRSPALSPSFRSSAWEPDWIVPDWPAPAHVCAVFTTRAGGVSIGAFDSLNLGLVPGDDPASVHANRARVADALGLAPAWLSQVHGVRCAVLRREAAVDPQATEEADACATADSGLVCAMRVADCLPVLFTDRAGSAVAAAHAGWRGLASGVLEKAVATLCSLCTPVAGEASVAPRELMAWLGPCIGPDAFEVGGDVLEAFLTHANEAAACFRPLHKGQGRSGRDGEGRGEGEGKWLADLQGLARQRLQAMGITAIFGNDGSSPWCTVSNPSRFFSHRRDHRVLGGSGRMAACIWREGSVPC